MDSNDTNLTTTTTMVMTTTKMEPSNWTTGPPVPDNCIYWVEVCGNNVFWNYSGVSSSVTRPQIPICFQNTVLTWTSCFILWLLTPFYICYLRSRRGPEVERCAGLKRSWLNWLKLFITAVQTIIPLLEIIVIGSLAPDNGYYLQFMLASAIRFVTMFIAWCFISYEFTKGLYTSTLFTIYWLVYVIINAFSVYSFAYVHENGTMVRFELVYFILFGIGYSLAIAQLLLNVFLVDRKLTRCFDKINLGSTLTDSRVNLIGQDDGDGGGGGGGDVDGGGGGGGGGGGIKREEDYVEKYPTFASSLFFFWVNAILLNGMRRDHNSSNIPQIPRADHCSSIVPPFETELNEAYDRYYTPKNPKSAIYRGLLFRTMAPALVGWGFVRLLSIILLIVNLIIFKQLIAYVKSAEHVVTPWLGYLYSVGLLLVAMVRALCVTHWLNACDRMGLKLKILITTTVYKKMLRLSSSCASQDMDIGYISNLMSIDSLKLFQSVRSLHEILTMPIYLVLALIFLYSTLGVAGIIGMVCLIAFVPTITFMLARVNKTLQEKQMLAKDRRLKFISEILAGIKVLKLYAWEDPFEQKVGTARKNEMKSIWLSSVYNGLGTIVCLISPFLVSLIIFCYYVYVEQFPLDPGDAFVCLSLICMLNCSISVVPCSFAFLNQGYISVKKASTLMDMDEVEGDLNRTFVERGPALLIENSSFSWDGTKPHLRDINLSITPGKLVAVVGLVGSGKSSLLAAMLGEMKTMKGGVKIYEKTVYVSQQAWIQNCTVRENICLNRPYVQKKYNKVVYACHLTSDLEKFPGGDLSELGSKGANLSGGQRQRVNLARAVYSKADLYLIDDSLSAVDPQVAKHIFKEVISRDGLLRKKTRIFATNSIGFLPEMDQIIVMNSGSIECVGTYEEIMQRKGDYFTFLQEHANIIEAEIVNKVTARSLSVGPGSIIPFEEERMKTGLAMKQLSNYEKTYWARTKSQSAGSFRMMSLADDMDMSCDYEPDDQWQPSSFAATTSQITREKVDSGQIRWRAVGDYIKSGGLLIFMIVLVGHLIMLMSQCASYVWLQRWTDNVTNGTLDFYVSSYGIIGLVEILSIIIISLIMAYGFSSASRVLHDKAIKRLFRAPISYFDTTSPGQTFNYLSTDLDTVDCALPLDVQLWLISFCVIISSIGTIAYADPLYLAITLPIMFISAIVQRIYGRSAIQLRREYALKKTPVYSHFEESVYGAVSIRSYRKQKLFMSKADKLNDESHRPWHSYLACWRWYTLYNELMGVLAIFLTAITAVVVEHQRKNTAEEVTPGHVALALFSIFQILPHIPIATRMMIEIEAHIVAVERLMKCASIDQEASRQSERGSNPPDSWPERGHINFRDVCVRHRPDLDNVLKHLTFDIESRNKIGVVGETGAGKSSIIMSLFRMMETHSGSIVIDGFDISKLGLHDLRSKLTCIPQEPILFSGTLRSNLDALKHYPDEQIWNSLVQAQLKVFIEENMPTGLDHVINSEEEVCVGQRQLICLARALLRNSKIIVLDEPTAAVDYQTDRIIQDVIRKEFVNSTIITVAHRLATIKDCDKILVLDKGEVLEYDSPENLLSNPNSKFSQMDRMDNKKE